MFRGSSCELLFPACRVHTVKARGAVIGDSSIWLVTQLCIAHQKRDSSCVVEVMIDGVESVYTRS